MPDAVPPARRVFITVAEVSGDNHAAQLVRSLRHLDPTVGVEALGGPALRAAGATIHHETVRSAAMGLAAARRGPEVFRLLRWTRRHFDDHRPDLQVCCDSWGMNGRFAKLAHDAGVPVLYYIAPQAWASREGRVKQLRQRVDRLACILPFEERFFRDRGVPATFVGHPLFDELPPRRPRPPVPPAFTADRPPVVGLLPGSRRGEAAANFPPMLDVAHRIRTAFSGARFLIPTTTATDPIVRRHAAAAGTGDLTIRLDAFDELVPRCDLCVTVSGTATLHVASHGVPMLVVYRLPAWQWHLAARWVIKSPAIALVNLLNGPGERLVPEFFPWYGNAGPVAGAAIDMLSNTAMLAAQTAGLDRLVRTLDHPGASMNVARLAVDLMDRSGTT
jgi:lipid-A-disaccharide synthase